MGGPSSHGQRNKAHKAGRFAGPSARQKARAGKEANPVNRSHKASLHVGKMERLVAAKQNRDNKRNDLMSRKRRQAAPVVVGVLPLSQGVELNRLWLSLRRATVDSGSDFSTSAAGPNGALMEEDVDMDLLLAGGESSRLPPCFIGGPPSGVASTASRGKPRFMLLPPPTQRSDLLAFVDFAKAAEVLLMVLPADENVTVVDEEARKQLAVLRAFGVPSVVACVAGPSGAASAINNAAVNLKERSAAKKRAEKALEAHLPGDYRILHAETPTDFSQLLRHLHDTLPSLPKWRQQRPSLLVEKADFCPSSSNPNPNPNPNPNSCNNNSPTPNADSQGILKLTGYVRCGALSANQIVTIPAAGDFKIQAIYAATEPVAWAPASRSKASMMMMTTTMVNNANATAMGEAEAAKPLALPNPDEQEELIRENEVDDMDGEQTWPTEEEMAAAAEAARRSRNTKRVPVGTSSYQAAWILDHEDEDGARGGGGGNEEDMMSDEGGEGGVEDPFEDEYEEIDVRAEDPFSLKAKRAAAIAAAAEAAKNKKSKSKRGGSSTGNPSSDLMLDDDGDDDDHHEDNGNENHDADIEPDEEEGEEGRAMMEEDEDDEDDEAYAEALAERRERRARDRAAAVAAAAAGDKAAADELAENAYLADDEVEAPLDQAARTRFQKYRGLKSLRSSPWDPKESLPSEYARVFAFENFTRAHRRAKEAAFAGATAAEAVAAGTYVCVHVEGVSAAAAATVVARVHASMSEEERVEGMGSGVHVSPSALSSSASSSSSSPVTVFGLLNFETRMSVINFAMKKVGAYSAPIKNKEQLLFVTGLRSFAACPILSDDAPGMDKHKMERSLSPGTHCMASVYGPIMFPPLPLLAFKIAGGGDGNGSNGNGSNGNGGNSNSGAGLLNSPLHTLPTLPSSSSSSPSSPSSSHTLAATGALRGCDPDRVVLKRIVLTGLPVRVHKRRATVKYMFHNPDDIRWFKPIEIHTRLGRRGRIEMPLGTHGAMKCFFDAPVQQRDDVCLPLYKRVFPKWPKDLTFA